MMDEEVLRVKSAESVMVHEHNEQASTKIRTPSWVGVNHNEDKRRNNSGHKSSSEHMRVKRGRCGWSRRKTSQSNITIIM